MAEVTVSLPDELVTRIDDAGRAEQRTRGELIHEAIEQYLLDKGRLRRWKDPAVLNAIATQDRIARLAEGQQSDELAEIRRMRESRR